MFPEYVCGPKIWNSNSMYPIASFLNTGTLKIDSQLHTPFLRELGVLHLTVNLLFNSCNKFH